MPQENMVTTFTEEGVAMLSSVLNSSRAVQVNANPGGGKPSSYPLHAD